MKNRFLKALLSFALALTLALPASAAFTVNAQAAIALNVASKTLYVGESYQLEPYGTTKSVTWKSDNTKIATVSKSGVVKGVAKGTATITATSDSKKYTCKITVINPSLSKTKITIDSGTLDTSIVLTGTDIASVSSSDTKVAYAYKYTSDYEYDYSGNESRVYIKALIPGTTTVSVKGTNGKTYKCTVTVNDHYVVTKEVCSSSGDWYDSKITKEYKYNKKGLVTEEKTTNEYGEANSETLATTYTYYASGKIKTEKSTSDSRVFETTYDEDGHEITSKEYHNSVLTYEYINSYKDGKQISRENRQYDEATGEFTGSHRTEYEYDELGRETKRSVYEDGKLNYSSTNVYVGLPYTLEYDSNIDSNVFFRDYKQYYTIEEAKALKGNNVYFNYDHQLYSEYDADGKLTYGYTITYDKSGRVTKASNASEEYSFTYNKNGLITKETYKGSWDECTTTNTYDGNMKLIASSTTYPKSVSSYKMTYNKAGQLTKYESNSVYDHSWYDGDELIEEKETYETTYSMEYNKYGKLAKVTYNSTGYYFSESSTTEYSYDKYGNVSSIKKTGTDSSGTDLAQETSYTYDKNGNQTKKIEYGTEWISGEGVDGYAEIQVKRETSREYTGNVLTKETLKVYQYYPKSDKYKLYYTTVDTYKDGRFSSSSTTYAEGSSNNGSDSKNEYDENGNLIKEYGRYFEITYDSNGNILTTIGFDDEAHTSIYSTTTYTYDKKGNLTLKSYQSDWDYYTQTFTYDKNGRCTSEAYTSDWENYNKAYTFDKNGNRTKYEYASENYTEVTETTYALLSKAGK